MIYLSRSARVRSLTQYPVMLIWLQCKPRRQLMMRVMRAHQHPNIENAAAEHKPKPGEGKAIHQMHCLLIKKGVVKQMGEFLVKVSRSPAWHVDGKVRQWGADWWQACKGHCGEGVAPTQQSSIIVSTREPHRTCTRKPYPSQVRCEAGTVWAASRWKRQAATGRASQPLPHRQWQPATVSWAGGAAASWPGGDRLGCSWTALHGDHEG